MDIKVWHSHDRRIKSVAAAAASMFIVIATVGCGEAKPATLPVSGKITWKGQPLDAGFVQFLPDSTKGNLAKVSPMGRLDANGGYQLTSDGQPGAPLGWYKITISGQGMPRPGEDMSKRAAAIAVDPKYTNENTTDLTVEVVKDAKAGRYDFDLPR